MSRLSKCLIANRGEIAVRITRACRELGIRVVAVYTEVDARARHVELADEAYPLGAPEAYLDGAKLIDVAKNNKNSAVRQQAMFWLGQTNDPRAIKFFEDVLLK